ncbi:serine--tRNA ligase [Candidatus Falkowbacteria bacterium CG10_big_fil_rev_8_21_14_0_10_39_11]|uniref:Serine--tRNA ligase n=1 Tax=Candidatus Falkowbacteria bacterium CG10_big_fil_rev_8_21_14_0_10_39_11 TaxID=1974565 RepID=A0A2H0V687_9BACT|nr:MAG: serine--tRNA ligase [Candidatus Falkowbacteria bacterium CG10_big_fil_rev_8_21_14_0_10_39_11]
MLDIKFIRENLNDVITAAENKNIKIDFDKLLQLDDKRRDLTQKSEEFRMKKNEASKQIPKLEGIDKEYLLAEMKTLTEDQNKIEDQLIKIKAEFDSLMLLVPMVPSKETPVGKDEDSNEEIKRWGELRTFEFDLKDHMTLGRDLDIIDNERAAKIAGSRSYILKGDGARLEYAVLKYAMDFIARKNYILMSVPVMVNRFALEGTGFFPGNEDDIYELEKDNKFLVGTSEVPLGAYYFDEVVDMSQLPIKFSGVSTCYRRESGTYGKDTHGLYRVHQFNKIEQFVICKGEAEESQKAFDELKANTEEFLQSLNLPYRVLNVCTGDMGKGKYYMNDLECWMPSRDGYGETHSCSNLHDFQARRLNLRYKDESGKMQFCHTLNNTMVATPRILIPIIENNQNEDGSITIPEVLRPYMANQEKIEKK